MPGEIIFDRPPVRARMCKHGPMIYYTTDQYIGRSLDLYGEYSEGEIDFFRQLLGPGMVVVDVGANIGVFTVFFAGAVGPTGRVHAFEPQRSLYHVLCGNLALNGSGNVAAAHAALGAEAGTILLPKPDYAKHGNFGGFALGAPADAGGAADQVCVSTLDTLGLDQCRLVKIDVEGMELEVLRGASETLARCRPLLYVENDRDEKSAELIEWLLDRDHRLFWHLPRLFNPRNHFGERSNAFGNLMSINMFCVPRSLGVRVHHLYEILSPADDWRVADAILIQPDPELAGYEAALARRPDDVAALNNRGLVLSQRRKRFDEALEAFDKALAIQPNLVETHYNRGNTLRELRRHDEALASYDKALAVNPDFVAAINNRGWVLQQLKRLDEALASYERALAVEPDHATSRANHESVLRELEQSPPASRRRLTLPHPVPKARIAELAPAKPPAREGLPRPAGPRAGSEPSKFLLKCSKCGKRGEIVLAEDASPPTGKRAIVRSLSKGFKRSPKHDKGDDPAVICSTCGIEARY